MASSEELFSTLDAGQTCAVLFISKSHRSAAYAEAYFSPVRRTFSEKLSFVIDVDSDEGREYADILLVAYTPQLRIYKGYEIQHAERDVEFFERYIV